MQSMINLTMTLFSVKNVNLFLNEMILILIDLHCTIFFSIQVQAHTSKHPHKHLYIFLIAVTQTHQYTKF